jgi:transcriptional regulator with XRE-family HTH domain
VTARQPSRRSSAEGEPAVAFGRNIRLVRQGRSLSMQALAEAAGISRAWLSEIERGTASPSVDIVRRLADALGVTISSLLDGRAEQVPSPEQVSSQGSGPVWLIRRDSRLTVRLPSQQFSWELLTPLRGELQLMIAHIDPSGTSIEMMEHSGQELVFVLAGEIEVKVAGQLYDLHVGDAISFPAQLAHGFRNRGKSKATMLNATAPPSLGEHAH